MNVWTYWDRGDPPDKLFQYWKRSWESKGFTACLATEKEAIHHPLYSHLCKKIATLPTLNSERYHRAIFVRWLAFACLGGSGIFCDFDVINFGLTEFSSPEEIVCLDSEVNIACIYATPAGLDALIHGFLSIIPNWSYYSQPHICDMTFFQKWYRGPHLRHCSSNRFPERISAPIVHFHNGACPPEWRQDERWRAVQDLANERANHS